MVLRRCGINFVGSTFAVAAVSIAAGGKQHIAIPTGLGIFRGFTGKLSPDIYQPDTGNALYVFALADRP